MKTLISIFVVAVVVALSGCSQPPVACTVSTFTAYAAKYQLVEGDGACAELAGDFVGMSPYNPAGPDGLPNLNEVFVAIRTELVGALAARAKEEGNVDADNEPHAFGKFTSAIPENDICTPDLTVQPRQVLPEIPDDFGDEEDPDDDVFGMPETDVAETWEDVQVYVTAAALGTQMKARYTFADNVEGCTATYDVLAVFPAVSCEDSAPEGEAIEIVSIDDNDEHLVEVQTSGAHGFAVGDVVEIVDVDDGEASYDGVYTVGALVDGDDTRFITEEVDPFDGVEPDDAVAAGTVQKFVSVVNEDFCSPVAIPAKGIPFGTGISPDFPVKCDPDLFLCVLDAEPSSATLPIVK